MQLPDVMEIKFEGGGVTPEIVRLSELTRLLKLFEDYVVRQLRNTDPEVKKDEIYIALNSIHHASAGYGIFSSRPEPTLAVFYQLGNAVQANNYVGLVPESRELAKAIVSFTRRHNCTAYLMAGRDYTVPVTPDTKVGGVQTLRGETQIYGVLERVGGADPRFTLRVSEHEALHGSLSEELAIALAPRLYSWVGITGIAEWNLLTGDIESFKATGMLSYKGTPFRKAMELLRGAVGEYLEDNDEREGEILYKIRQGEIP